MLLVRAVVVVSMKYSKNKKKPGWVNIRWVNAGWVKSGWANAEWVKSGWANAEWVKSGG